MTRFRFRLESLLKLREHHEDMARMSLAQAHRRVRQAQDELYGVVHRRVVATQAVSGPDGPRNVAALQAGYAHLQLLAETEAHSRARLASLSAEHEERREEAIAAQRARETLERLRQRRQQLHARQLQRAEALRLDEAGSQQAARRIMAQRQVGRSGS